VTAVAAAKYASPMEAGLHGAHVTRLSLPRFDRPIDADLATPGRLHLYGSWSSPGSHRAAIVRALLNLDHVVSMSYVDNLRDARGWAFRESTGADPVNGFTLLREAYERTEPGYDGPVSVPVLWDRYQSRIVSNAADSIDVGLATAFAGRRFLYPALHRDEIDDMFAWIDRTVSSRLGPSVYDDRSRSELLTALQTLSTRLSAGRFLVGDAISLADIRLWVSLVRYDAGPNAHGAVGPKLSAFDGLWGYARWLYQLPAFRQTTRLRAIAAPFATLPEW